MQSEDLRRLLRFFNPWWQHQEARPGTGEKPADPHTQNLVNRAQEVSSTVDTLVIGPRASGKTHLVGQLIGRLLDTGHPSANVCLCDLGLPALRGIRLAAILDAWLESAPVVPGNAMRLFLDGVDLLRDWRDQLRELAGQGLRITATALTDPESDEPAGPSRTPWKSFPLATLNFLEFLEVTGHQAARSIPAVPFEDLLGMEASQLAEVSGPPENGLQEAFLDYLCRGLFPGPALAPDRASGQLQILGGVLRRILREDLPGRHNARQPALIEELVTHLACRGDSELNLARAAAELGIPGRQSIENFAALLVESGLYRRIPQAGPPAARARHKLVPSHPAIQLSHLLAGDDLPDNARLMGPALESAARLHLSRHYSKANLTHQPHRAADPRGLSADLVIDTPLGRLAVEVISGRLPPTPGRLRRFARFLEQKPGARGVILTQSPPDRAAMDPADPESGAAPRGRRDFITILPAALACLALSRSHVPAGESRLGKAGFSKGAGK